MSKFRIDDDPGFAAWRDSRDSDPPRASDDRYELRIDPPSWIDVWWPFVAVAVLFIGAVVIELALSIGGGR